METFSKIAERIINQRLIEFAKLNGLYLIRQTGSLLQRVTFDAGISLKHWVQEAQAAGLKASTMFLDIKGGFDNVDHSTLLRRLQTNSVPDYMVKWISNFISYRQCTIVRHTGRLSLPLVNKDLELPYLRILSSKGQANTPLPHQRWDGATSADPAVVASHHQRHGHWNPPRNPYTSQPSVRPDPVRRIYEGRPLASLCKWFEPNRWTSHKATEH